MKKLLIQSDDYGFTYGIADGTIHAIKHGIVRNFGLFTNMPSSAYAASRALEVADNACFGIEINLAGGRPISDPNKVKHLVDDKGVFRLSTQIKKEYKKIKDVGYMSYFEEDPYNYEECLIEVEAQVKRFIELTGRKPEFLNAHSIMTENIEKAENEIIEKYGIKAHSSDIYFGKIPCIDISRPYEFGDPVKQLNTDYLKDYMLNKALPSIEDDKLYLMIFHCGFVDEDIFPLSSLTIDRMHDAGICADKDVIKYINDNDIKLVTYRDIY